MVSLWYSQQELSQEVFLGDGDGVRAEGQRAWEPQGQTSAHNGDRLLPGGRTQHQALKKHSQESLLRWENPHAHCGGP